MLTVYLVRAVILVAESPIYNNFRGFGAFGTTEVTQTGNCRFCRKSHVEIDQIRRDFHIMDENRCSLHSRPAGVGNALRLQNF